MVVGHTIADDIHREWRVALRDFSFITILIRAGLSLNPKGLMLMKSVVIRLALCPGQLSTTTTTTIDRFKKFARLGTSLLISDAIILISATIRGKRTSDDLAKSIYRFQGTVQLADCSIGRKCN